MIDGKHILDVTCGPRGMRKLGALSGGVNCLAVDVERLRTPRVFLRDLKAAFQRVIKAQDIVRIEGGREGEMKSERELRRQIRQSTDIELFNRTISSLHGQKIWAAVEDDYSVWKKCLELEALCVRRIRSIQEETK